MPVDRVKPPPRPGDKLFLLHRLFLNQYQMRLVALYGGEPGVADGTALDRVMGDADEAAGPERQGDVFAVAAAYGLGLINGPYRGGNLRLAAVAMATVILINGFEFEPPPAELEQTMRAIAERRISRDALVAWLRGVSRPVA